MRSRRHDLCRRALLVLCLTAVPARGAEEQIDDFVDASALTMFVANTNVLRDSVGGTVRTDPNLSGVIGGVRELTVTAESLDTGADFLVAGVSAMPVAFLEYNSTVGADGATALFYDAGGTGLNVFLAFAMGIRVQIITASPAAVAPPGLDVTLTLTDTSMATASVTQTVLLPVTPMAPLDLDFFFSAFAGVDAGSLFSIALAIDPQVAGDLRLAGIETFGTPTTENICDDGIDNNNNGFTDCDDQDCITFPGCASQAPALAPSALLLASAALSLIGLLGIGRLRRRAG